MPRPISDHSTLQFVVSTTTILVKLAKCCSVDTFEWCGSIFQPEGKLETPGLVQTQMFEKSRKPGVNACT